jgi:glycosyltransferase involved in cell wall biosynthesis
MLLTVLSVAFPFAPVGSDAVGGAEQILGSIDRALVSAGHSSLVVACEGSQTAGELFSFPLPEDETFSNEHRAEYATRVQGAIDRALAAHRVDLVHFHGLDADAYSVPGDIPALITLHLPVAWYRPALWTRFGEQAEFCCVSESQRRTLPAQRSRCTVIENGVPLPAIESARKGDFALVLGRVCPEKNAHEAFDAGTRAGVRVLLGGDVFPYAAHQQYFRKQIEPRLHGAPGGPEHAFLGRLPEHHKYALLSRAKCLLHPTLAPETSSLAAMEALAAGTPVIAYPSGALPEIVDDGVTGFLVDGVEEMAEALQQVRWLSPAACRQAAERRFSVERMIGRYLDLYAHLMERQPLEASCV